MLLPFDHYMVGEKITRESITTRFISANQQSTINFIWRSDEISIDYCQSFAKIYSDLYCFLTCSITCSILIFVLVYERCLALQVTSRIEKCSRLKVIMKQFQTFAFAGICKFTSYYPRIVFSFERKSRLKIFQPFEQ